MNRTLQGSYVATFAAGDRAEAFVPAPLPPHPPISWTSALRSKFDRALIALGRLDSVSATLPDAPLLLSACIRKEAVLSSMIEGIPSSLSDLMLFELTEEKPGMPTDDVQEVSNCVAALSHGLKLLEEGLPLSVRLLKEVHQALMAKGRGSARMPGEFRTSQNWIGGSSPSNAVFVPPPPEQMLSCISDLERFLNDQPASTPALLKAALAHVQFETIHPFQDGNGRVGRLLILLLLCRQKALSQPMLYLSLYFNMHRRRYYTLLNEVRLSGNWEAWLDFFADAVIYTSTDAMHTVQELAALAEEDRETITCSDRVVASAVKIHQAMLEYPMTHSRGLTKKTGLTPSTVNGVLDHLGALGMVTEVTGRKRDRLFSYTKYLAILNRGTDPADS